MNLINKNIFLNKNDQEKSFMAIKDREDQNIEIFLKKIIKDLRDSVERTIMKTMQIRLLFAWAREVNYHENLSSPLTTVKTSLLLLSGIIAYRYKQITTEAQIKVKKLIIFLIRLENYMCMGASNITRWVSKACSVISNVATRDIHIVSANISSGFLFNNKIKQGDI